MVFKLLIDFNGDTRHIRCITYIGAVFTPLKMAKEYECPAATIRFLTEYSPSEEEKLTSKLERKRRVDLMFKDKGCPRFKQAEIDLKFQSIDAVKTGGLDLLVQCLPQVDEPMSISLTIVAIELDALTLWAVYSNSKLVRERVFEMRRVSNFGDKSVELLLYILNLFYY